MLYVWTTFSLLSEIELTPGSAYRNEFGLRTLVLNLNR